MMHIALLVKDFAVGEKFSKDGLPTKSGAEFHAENHAKELIKRGHTVTIFTRKRHFYTKARECMDGIDLVRLHEPLRGLELLVRLLTTHKTVDAFYIIGTPKFAVWAIHFAHARNFPVTLALTGTFEVFDKEMNWRNRIFSTCTNYVATTHEICEGYIVRGHIAPERISVLAHGIDTDRYVTADIEKKRFLRKEYGISSEGCVLLFCARIVLRKGVDTLLKFWPLVHAADATARLLIVGGGEHELVRQLHEMAKETDGSALILGEVDQPEPYYQMSDVYVFPSRAEGLPTSLLEAMASGLPAITSDIGGCDDLVFNGETGYRVPTEDAAAFAEKILHLFEDEEERKRMGDASRALVERMCSYSVVIDKLAEIIQSKKPCGKDYLIAGIEER